MKHLFIVNPAAGQYDHLQDIEQELKQIHDLDFQIHSTTGVGEATVFLRKYLSANPQPVRIYACGGDGTLNEVINGAAGFAHASVGCYPCGSGNDFVKYYGGQKYFLDLKALIAGKETPIDLIQVNDRYAVNACHFGLDSAVAAKIGQYKRLPFVNGKAAYLLGVLWALIFAMRTKCSVSCDGKIIHSGDMLLCTLANGTHVGGSYRCAPKSDNSDGLAEVCLVKPVSRIKFLSLMNEYKSGNHLDNPSFTRYIHYQRASQMSISAGDGFAVSLDGELVYGKEFNVTFLHKAMRFIVPAGAPKQV